MDDNSTVNDTTDYGNQELQRIMGAQKAGLPDQQLSIIDKGLLNGFYRAGHALVQSVNLLITLLVKGIGKVLGELDPAFGTLAASVIGNMFDVDVDTSAFTSMTARGTRREVSKAVGDALLAAFKGEQAAVGAGELQPSTDSAEHYLATMANLAVEGWVFDVFGGLVPFAHLDHIGDLKDSMARVLGLGRLSRTVLRPFVNTLIATPAQWAVNKQYRPKMLSVSEAIDAVNRGDLDEATLLEIAARDGYGDDALVILRAAAIKPLSADDAQLLADAGELSSTAVVDEARRGGADPDRAELLGKLHEARLLHKFELQMVTAAADAYADRKIDEPRLLELLSANTISTRALNRIHELASQRRSVNVLHLSRGDVEAAVKLEVLSVTDYHDWLEARGYAHDDALTLELLLQAELKVLEDKRAARAAAAAAREATKAARTQAAQTKRDLIAAEHAHWTGTLGQAERLVVRNVMAPVTYRQILVDHGITGGDADELVSVATQDRDARQAMLAKRAAAAGAGKPPTLPLGTLIHAILIKARPIDALAPAMRAAGYADDQIALETDVVTSELALRAAADAARAKNAPTGTTKALTLAQLERAVLNGAGTVDRYQAALITAGFNATDTALLVADLKARLEARQFADERRALAEQRLEASHLSLAQQEQAVLKGVQTLDDYQLYLAAHGFDANDQAILVQLLEQKLGG